MLVLNNPDCRTLKLDSFVHPASANKPGTLFRLNIAEWVPEFFPKGCPESYFITTMSDERARRGAHSHPVGSKAEIFIMLSGRAHVELHSAKSCGAVILDTPDEALLIIPGVWHAITLEPNSLLMVYASLTMEEGREVNELPCNCHKP
jgi:quercetin dioxygenase-like cupin family protein